LNTPDRKDLSNVKARVRRWTHAPRQKFDTVVPNPTCAGGFSCRILINNKAFSLNFTTRRGVSK
jgi:hypothetical protein